MPSTKIKSIIISPFEKFMKIESWSGILLSLATLLALVWANSSVSESYFNLRSYELGLSLGSFELKKPLILWINDGLMTIFFFLIGLEVKREILIGELNTLKKASLPIFAAIGGVVVPITLFLLLNQNQETIRGWGIPMATDIAFSLAILTSLGKRVPLALKIFLTALAIVDDILAVLAIAFFYSSEIDWILIAYALAPFAILTSLLFLNIYSKYASLVLGVIIWFLFLKSGIHPTIAGILIAFTIPFRQKNNVKESAPELKEAVDSLLEAKSVDAPILTKDQIYELDNLYDLSNKIQSPVQHIEHNLHGWVAYLIIPLFAFANAGVSFTGNSTIDTALSLNLALALLFGKSVGISLFAFLSSKLKLSNIPSNISFYQIIGVGLLSGIGFTMSIFIANLAFANDNALIDASKIGILIGSVVAGLAGYLVLRFTGKKPITTK